MQETTEGEYILSLGDLLGVIRRRLWVVLLVGILMSGAVVGYEVFIQTPEYRSSIRILIGQERGGDPSSLGADVQGLQDVTLTMAEAVNSRSVAEGVVERLNLPMTPGDVLDNISAEQVSTTQFIEVSYTDTDPERAERVANAIGAEFSDKVSQVATGTNNVTAAVWDSAVAPDDPASPNPLRDGVLAFVVGLMLGIGLAFLIDYLDESWQSVEEVELVAGAPTFGVIPEFKPVRPKSKGGV